LAFGFGAAFGAVSFALALALAVARPFGARRALAARGVLRGVGMAASGRSSDDF
jgi:hypothetical protein